MKATNSWLKHSGADYLPPAGFTGYAQLSHYTAEYSDLGDGPPIVLVHGLAGGTNLLGPIVRSLMAQGYRVITYKLRGEDNCFDIRRSFSIDDLVEDLREFVDLLCLESPTIFGVSFGGILALHYACKYPGRLDRLVVQGVGSRFEAGFLQKIAGAVLSRFPLPSNSPFVNQFFNLLFGFNKKKDELSQFVIQQCWTTDQSVMAHRFQLVETFNLDDRLKNIKVPSLVFYGEKDILVSARILEDLCNGIEGSKLIRLPNVGHLAFVTHSEYVAQKVNQFSKR